MNNRTAAFHVKLSIDERQILETVARTYGLTPSALVRLLVMREAARKRIPSLPQQRTRRRAENGGGEA